MKNLLDKTITLRQFLSYFGMLCVLSIVTYVYVYFKNAWYQKLDGAVANQSPYVQLVPENCRKAIGLVVDGSAYAGSATSGVGILESSFLLKPRTREVLVEHFITNSANCLGWSIVTGLHGVNGNNRESNSNSNFQINVKDEKNEEVVSITVKYSKPFNTKVGS